MREEETRNVRSEIPSGSTRNVFRDRYKCDTSVDPSTSKNSTAKIHQVSYGTAETPRFSQQKGNELSSQQKGNELRNKTPYSYTADQLPCSVLLENNKYKTAAASSDGEPHPVYPPPPPGNRVPQSQRPHLLPRLPSHHHPSRGGICLVFRFGVAPAVRTLAGQTPEHLFPFFFDAGNIIGILWGRRCVNDTQG